MIRQPIVAVLGHVDHGKTTLLDRLRGTTVASREAGGITQHIGATELPIDTLYDICGEAGRKLGLSIPGLLFIDTPGHEAFTTLRSRGGSLADIAILIVDINEQLQPQTIESLNILKQFKTPFILVLNKIDRIRGWEGSGTIPFVKAYNMQTDDVKRTIDNRMYEFIGKLYEFGFESQRFDQIRDFSKSIAIIPASAKEGISTPDIMMLIAGLSQKFLEKRLDIEADGPAKGTVLEVKEASGFGMTIDVIINEGTLHTGDIIIVGGKNGIIKTKVRALLKPKPLDEIRDPRFRFDTVESVTSAAGIKIAAPNLGESLSGSPLLVAENDSLEEERAIQKEMARFRIHQDATGLIVKADTLGSLEAVVGTLREKEISMRSADIGDIQKKDIVEAVSVAEKNIFDAVILGFNVSVTDEVREMAKKANIPIIESNIIYKLIEDYEEFIDAKKREEEERKKMGLVMPGKFMLLPKLVFRNAKPAIVGIEVLGGTIAPKLDVINEEGVRVGKIKALKDGDKFLKSAELGQQVAMSLDGPVVGRQVHEGEVLYIDMPKSNIEKLKELDLSKEEDEIVAFLSNLKKKELFTGWVNGS